jgi:hypothetical protein
MAYKISLYNYPEQSLVPLASSTTKNEKGAYSEMSRFALVLSGTSRESLKIRRLGRQEIGIQNKCWFYFRAGTSMESLASVSGVGTPLESQPI